MKVLITGAGGQLAKTAASRMEPAHRVVALTHAQLDVTRHADVTESVSRERPDVIINGAAFNDVDGAEAEPVTAMAVNTFGVRALARAAAAFDATLVHFGTDFIFDGTADHPYTEDASPNPQSVYAVSKLLGEWFACESRHYVLRVESLFGGDLLPRSDGRTRGSSLDRIADAMLAGVPVRAFTDRTVTPSYVDDIVDATVALLTTNAPPGVYHCVGSGMGTWMEVATHLAAELGCSAKINPVRMASMTLKAKRPQFCALSNAKLRSVGIVMPPWEDAVGRYARARLANGESI